MTDHRLELLLETMVQTLPVGFSVTLGLTRTDGTYLAHAAIHSQEPGQVLLAEHGDDPIAVAARLHERLLDGGVAGNGSI